MLDIFMQVLQPSVLLYMLAGVVLGIFIGALPGMTATMGIAILTPLTFWLEPQEGLAMLIAVYCSSIFAGGIPAILINTPGTPASIATTFDGYALSQQGKAGLALGINTIYSCLGGFVSTIFLWLAAFPIAEFALRFGPPEYFALAVFGLSMMVSVSGESVIKGLIAGGIGLFIATIGLDPMLSAPRFTFSNANLLDGLSFIPIMIGMFGLGEIFYQILHKSAAQRTESKTIGRILPNREERRRMRLPFWLSSMIGTIIGAIPATGGDIASIISWEQSKRLSKKPEEFGKGSLEGMCASSTANNAVIGGAFTTMLALGLPGDTVTAILIGSLMMYGMQPGPSIFIDHIDFVYVIIALLLVANLVVLVVGLAGAHLFSRIMLIRREIIWVSVIMFCIVGAFALNNSYFDVGIALASGILGLLFRKAGLPVGPFILALLLGKMAESNMRRSLALSDDGLLIFITSPISAALIFLAVLTLCWPVVKKLRMQTKNKKGA